jgi:hypothetical protein
MQMLDKSERHLLEVWYYLITLSETNFPASFTAPITSAAPSSQTKEFQESLFQTLCAVYVINERISPLPYS